MSLISHSLKVIFAGTPVFSVAALQVLLNSSHRVLAVYTQPDRPAGRGQKLTMSPVKEYALAHHLPVHQPLNFRDPTEVQTLANYQADMIIVVAYGIILPKVVLHTPRLGCLNIHASLLPRWRGAAPIQRAILAGDEQTGITIMQMDEGLDTGAMLYKTEIAIHTNDNSQMLHERLALLGADALLTTLTKLPDILPEPQDPNLATYAHKITKEEAKLDFQLSAVELVRKINAFNPCPVAFIQCGTQNVRIWEAEVVATSVNHQPGKILHADAEGVIIATGAGNLRLLKMQLPGSKVLHARDILNSKQNQFAVGKIVG